MEVYIDESEVLDQCSTKMLMAELEARKKKGDRDTFEPLDGQFTEHDIADIMWAVERGLAQELLSTMARCLGHNCSSARAA